MTILYQLPGVQTKVLHSFFYDLIWMLQKTQKPDSRFRRSVNNCKPDKLLEQAQTLKKVLQDLSPADTFIN